MEREAGKNQALNDFLVFTSISITSFTSGTLYHNFGWQVVNIGVVPLIAVILGAVLWLRPRRRLPVTETPV